MLNFVIGVGVGIALAVCVPAVYKWGGEMKAKYDLWRSLNKKT